MTNKIIQQAVKKASGSTCKYCIGAIGIDCKGRVLGTSRNRTRFNTKGGSIHAEMALMKQYGRKLKSIVIFRVTKGGNLRHMDPCNVCSAKAAELDIKITSLI
jgi:tRNA(Arg) A34 adenosine deaminase TadA